MKRFSIALLLVVLTFGIASFAVSNANSENLKNGQAKNDTIQTPIQFQKTENGSQNICEVSENSTIPDLARRGCCSHHGGVCGCDSATDRIVCCDNTYSPSCTCSGY